VLLNSSENSFYITGYFLAVLKSVWCLGKISKRIMNKPLKVLVSIDRYLNGSLAYYCFMSSGQELILPIKMLTPNVAIVTCLFYQKYSIVEPAVFPLSLPRSVVLMNDVDQIAGLFGGVIHLSSSAPTSGVSDFLFNKFEVFVSSATLLLLA